MKHKFAVFIGRFSPIHLGHVALLNKALEVAENVIVVIGSHNRAKNIKNPWSSLERQEMIESCLSEENKARTSFVFMNDYLYSDNQWIFTLQNKIAEASNDSEDIALVGFNSDDSSYYLNYFPKWKFYNCPTDYEFHATYIRDLLFKKDIAYKKCLLPNVSDFLEKWSSSQDFERLKEEYDYISNYKEQWRGAPFPISFNTVDAITICNGHVLLVRRGKSHGKGLLACPGGFIEQNEAIENGCIRELKEETKIKLSKEDLQKSITSSKVFDHPKRSERGRTISHAFLFSLKNIVGLPKVIGSDDADKAFWLPLNEVFEREAEFFEDHFYIIQYFLGINNI